MLNAVLPLEFMQRYTGMLPSSVVLSKEKPIATSLPFFLLVQALPVTLTKDEFDVSQREIALMHELPAMLTKASNMRRGSCQPTLGAQSAGLIVTRNPVFFLPSPLH
jgi:hypothetical protein